MGACPRAQEGAKKGRGLESSRILRTWCATRCWSDVHQLGRTQARILARILEKDPWDLLRFSAPLQNDFSLRNSSKDYIWDWKFFLWTFRSLTWDKRERWLPRFLVCEREPMLNQMRILRKDPCCWDPWSLTGKPQLKTLLQRKLVLETERFSLNPQFVHFR